MARLLKLLGNVHLTIYSIFLVSISYIFVGPFLLSEPWKWVETQIDGNPILSGIIDTEGMLFDSVISSTVPMLLVWGVVALAYNKFSDKVDEINSISKYLNYFTGGVGYIVGSIGLILFGVCCSWLVEYGYHIKLAAAIIIGLLLSITGFVFKQVSLPKVKKNQILDNHSRKIGVGCLAMSFILYLYTVLADPVKIILVFYNLYNNS